MKYSERLVEKIVRLIEQDTYTINEICRALKINPKTFYEWRKTKPEFRKAIEEAEDRRDDELAALARYSLRDQLEGYIEVTEKFVYEADGWGGEKLKSRTVTKKKLAPKPQLLKLVLERQDKRKEKRKEKAEAPADKPTIMKVPRDYDPMVAIQSVITFKEKMRNAGLPEKVVDSVKEEGDYITVVV